MRLEDLKVGDRIMVGPGWECMEPGVREVRATFLGVLYVDCKYGEHLLDAEVRNGELPFTWPVDA